jgi:alpha-amylase/alpha-mannosidase (GH57 family)
MSKLKVAFLWHMHQPCYRSSGNGAFRLPWVRMHGLKDYADMLQLALQYPELKMTFNLVPVLLEQLQDYSLGRATDYHFKLSQKPSNSLTTEEREFIVRDFFMAHWANMVEPYPRYRELLEKRGRHFHPAHLPQSTRKFTDQDITDLQVWFNLAWIDPVHVAADPELVELKAKMKSYTQEEKLRLLDRQMDILKSIIPAYQKAWQKGEIEISTSPYYHPILPLLCDTNVAKEGLPHSSLPRRFSYPRDAAAQLVSGQNKMAELLGRKAEGLWPSEGSVSDQTVKLAAESGFKWMATDEAILEKSLGCILRGQGEDSFEKAYRPYHLEGMEGLRIFFRDRILSDLIGFTYYSWEPQAAAADLISRLEGLAGKLGDKAGKCIVPVVLDGENAWESYINDGHDFLNALYSGLSRSNKLHCCTFGEYLGQEHETGNLSKIFPGSWINGDFSIWIGQDEDNRAWNELLAAREAIERNEHVLGGETREQVYRELYTAEGSDWCWWYGGNFSSENLEDFDLLFRGHLQRIYELLKLDAPSSLLTPISRGRVPERLISEPLDLIRPVVDGKLTSFYEWTGCGTYDIKQDGGTMHRGQSLLDSIHFGFDEKNLYLRLDPHAQFDRNELNELSVVLEFTLPEAWKMALGLKEEPPDGIGLAFGKIIEISLPFEMLNVKPGEKIGLFVSLADNGTTLERHPWQRPITITAPGNDFMAQNWGA